MHSIKCGHEAKCKFAKRGNQKVFDRYTRRDSRDETDEKSITYVAGIAGGSASGKSTFADHLYEKLSGLNVKMFHMDDYFREESERPIILGIWNAFIQI